MKYSALLPLIALVGCSSYSEQGQVNFAVHIVNATSEPISLISEYNDKVSSIELTARDYRIVTSPFATGGPQYAWNRLRIETPSGSFDLRSISPALYRDHLFIIRSGEVHVFDRTLLKNGDLDYEKALEVTGPVLTVKKESTSPQHNAGSRPSSGDSPASETPSAPAPRG
jgi:hypothetical protein